MNEQTCKFHGGMAQGTGGGGGGVVGRRASSSVLRALERTGYGGPLSYFFHICKMIKHILVERFT